MNILDDLCNKYDTDKGTRVREAHGYSLVYEQLFKPFKDEAFKMLEVGVLDPMAPGASLKVWPEFFPKAIIYGVDLFDASKYAGDRVITHVMDQGSRRSINEFFDRHGGNFRVIIDDASHRPDHQQIGLGAMFPFVSSGGYYIIEDLHAFYPNVFTLELLEHFINTDRMESQYMLAPEREYLNDHIENIWITERDKLAVIRKK